MYLLLKNFARQVMIFHDVLHQKQAFHTLKGANQICHQRSLVIGSFAPYENVIHQMDGTFYVMVLAIHSQHSHTSMFPEITDY